MEKKPQKRLIDSIVILNTAIVAYYLPIRFTGLLILQSARRPVGREKVLYVPSPPPYRHLQHDVASTANLNHYQP